MFGFKQIFLILGLIFCLWVGGMFVLIFALRGTGLGDAKGQPKMLVLFPPWISASTARREIVEAGGSLEGQFWDGKLVVSHALKPGFEQKIQQSTAWGFWRSAAFEWVFSTGCSGV